MIETIEGLIDAGEDPDKILNLVREKIKKARNDIENIEARQRDLIMESLCGHCFGSSLELMKQVGPEKVQMIEKIVHLIEEEKLPHLRINYNER